MLARAKVVIASVEQYLHPTCPYPSSVSIRRTGVGALSLQCLLIRTFSSVPIPRYPLFAALSSLPPPSYPGFGGGLSATYLYWTVS